VTGIFGIASEKCKPSYPLGTLILHPPSTTTFSVVANNYPPSLALITLQSDGPELKKFMVTIGIHL